MVHGAPLNLDPRYLSGWAAPVGCRLNHVTYDVGYHSILVPTTERHDEITSYLAPRIATVQPVIIATFTGHISRDILNAFLYSEREK